MASLQKDYQVFIFLGRARKLIANFDKSFKTTVKDSTVQGKQNQSTQFTDSKKIYSFQPTIKDQDRL